MNVRKREMAMINTKERLLSFLSASTITDAVFSLEKQATAGVQKQGKRVQSKKKEKLKIVCLFVRFQKHYAISHVITETQILLIISFVLL